MYLARRLIRMVVEDIGRCINPLIVHGQTVGAAVQGIGATILEELVYDDNGQLLSGTFMDYTLPTSTDAPSIDSIILEEAPSLLNPLGVKGAGIASQSRQNPQLDSGEQHAVPLTKGRTFTIITRVEVRLRYGLGHPVNLV